MGWQINGKFGVNFKETPDGLFPYLDIGRETHGRISFRLWVSHKLIDEGKIVFPLKATIVRTEKGSFVCKPSDDYLVHYIVVPSGFRGSSSLEVIRPDNAEVYPFLIYHSPRGHLGISQGALIVVLASEKVYVKWRRTGRLYGDPGEGILVIDTDGKYYQLEHVANGLEEIERLKELITD